MSPSRYELSDLQWEKIKDFLPGRKEHVGRTAADNRLFVNGVLWVLRSGARWADLPERYGKYKSVHKRFVRWANSGVWERVFHELVRDRKNQYLMLDSTIVRAHQQAATGRKKGARTRLWGVPGEVGRARFICSPMNWACRWTFLSRAARSMTAPRLSNYWASTRPRPCLPTRATMRTQS